MEQPRQNSLLTLPGAIIVAGTIIAIAIIWTQKPIIQNPDANLAAAVPNQAGQLNIATITNEDHILGDPNAPIKIVEYSDASCPFCKMFHPTMKQIIEEYGPEGKVAWVYRHFPLDKPDPQGRVLHPNAGYEAQAMECAAEIGGNEKFWAFTNRLYEVTPAVTAQTPAGLPREEIPKIAQYAGLDVNSFNECLSSGRYKAAVDADYIDGLNAGIQGTPFSVIITPTGTKIPITGAQPYANVKASIDAILSATR